MKRMLYEKFGSQCWGCDFQAPAGDRGIKYLELVLIRQSSSTTEKPRPHPSELSAQYRNTRG